MRKTETVDEQACRSETSDNKVLRGQVALVTGASLGIGRGVAIALAQAGADVAINYRSSAKEARQVADTVRQAGTQALLLQADVADQTAVEEMVAQTVAELGRLDIAVSNAAFSDRQFFYQADMEGFRRTVDVTMWGAFYLTRAAAQQMISQKQGGSIVVIGSPHGYTPLAQSMAYNMSKAANHHMARTAALELAEHRIRVNTIVPGWIDTPGERKFTSEEAMQAAATRIPLRRLGQSEEVARAVVFLSDRASEYITGAQLLIDGGITLPWWASGGTAAP